MELKRKLRSRCKEQLDAMASDFRKEMEDAQQSANEYGAPKDRYDAYRTQMLRKRDMFGQQLAKLNIQMDVLEKIDPERKCNVVEFGALVITSRQKLFIATGLGKIEVEGETYYAISAAVPIFKVMERKKPGDEVVFNGQKITILEIL
jgi:transcription elongation GreA/GreB family factor